MGIFWKYLREWLGEAYHEFGDLMLINALWFIFTILIVTAPPAAAGLYYATNILAHEERVEWRTFFEGFREYFWLSWRWALVNLAVILILFSNTVFYDQFQAQWSYWLQGVIWALLFVWGMLQVYVFPLLLEQTEKRQITALRNSLVIYRKRPTFALGMAGFILLISFLGVRFLWPVWIVILGSLCAYLANHSTIYLVNEITGREEE